MKNDVDCEDLEQDSNGIPQNTQKTVTKRKRTLMDYVIEKTIDIEGRNNKKFIATCR